MEPSEERKRSASSATLRLSMVDGGPIAPLIAGATEYPRCSSARVKLELPRAAAASGSGARAWAREKPRTWRIADSLMVDS